MAKPPRKSREARHTILVNGQALRVTSEERFEWRVCAGALSGELPEMRLYWDIRESNQLRSKLQGTAPRSLITVAAPASQSIGAALDLLRCGVWEPKYEAHRVLKLNNLALDLSLDAPLLPKGLDEAKLLRSLHEPADLQAFLIKRSDQLVARKVERARVRLQADEHVGYASPPRAQRFQPGQSGWRKGGPRRTPRMNIIGEQIMPGLTGRGRKAVTVNDKVLERLQMLAKMNVRYARLWWAVKEREDVWRKEQKKRLTQRVITLRVYEDVSEALCELGIARKLEGGATRIRPRPPAVAPLRGC